MVRCKEYDCKDYGDICCFNCVDRADCTSSCSEDPTKCGKSVTENPQELTLFQSNALSIMQKIADLDKLKKALEAQDKAVRQELQEAMDKYGVKKFENDILKVTYVEPTTRTSIDSARLKKELPAVAEKYTKVSQVKGSVRIEVK